MVDMISRRAFEAINLPLIQAMVEEIRRLGMHSIYYYCGDPKGKLDLLLETGADALSLEESKKGFYHRYPGLSGVCGWPLRPAGKPGCHPLYCRGQTKRSCARRSIGRSRPVGANRGRFVMSIRQPGDTRHIPERVRQYTDLTHALGENNPFRSLSFRAQRGIHAILCKYSHVYRWIGVCL